MAICRLRTRNGSTASPPVLHLSCKACRPTTPYPVWVECEETSKRPGTGRFSEGQEETAALREAFRAARSAPLLLDQEVLTSSDGVWAERRATRGQAGQERKPLGIAIPKDAEQVARIVRSAKAQRLEVTVRTGGNDYFGRNVVDNGLIIDMRSIDFINVAGDRKSATIGGGVIPEHLVRRFEEEGVIAPYGNAWIVGYVGWATLGGYGPLTNLFGMGFEGIVAAQVVTSEGEVVEAPADLLEGNRGAGRKL